MSTTDNSQFDQTAVDGWTNDELLLQWQQCQSMAKIYREREMLLRKAAVNRMFPNAGPGTNGTENVPLGNGYKLKCVFKLNHKLIPDTLPNAANALIKHSADGEFIVNRLISYKPELSVAEYKRLSKEQVLLLAPALVITDGAPELEIVPPKAKAV